MLSVALSRAAVDAGHRVVYFTTAAELAAKCHKAALEGRWKTCMRFFAGPKLLIIDELGLSTASRGRCLRAVPGDQPEVSEVEHDPEDQRRHRRLGRSLR
ncbi:ATP-binding protein [Streptomyces sp. NPDC054775]